MQDMIFLLPTDASLTIAKLVIGDEFLEWAKRARHNHERLKEEDKFFDNLRYRGDGLNLSFVELSPSCDLELIDDLHGMLDNVMLPATADPAWFKVIEASPREKCISVCHNGVQVSGAIRDFGIVTSYRLHWNELGIPKEDARRCRYRDCAEAHPVAGESELVTCHTCRKEMALPTEEKD